MTIRPEAPSPGDLPPPAPHGVAVSGIVFAVLFSTSLVLLRLAVPANPSEPGAWLGDPAARYWLEWSLTLIPLAGISFLWFMGVIRDHVAAREDRFFATVFLGSGILLVGLLFVAGGIADGVLRMFGSSPHGSESLTAGSQAAFVLGRRLASSVMNNFATRMAAVFLFVTSSIGLRTRAWPRWISFTGYACGLVLLLFISESTAVLFLLPAWVLLVSLWFLWTHVSSRAPAG
ncbi:MAG: hypothetical protein ACK6D3_00025 [Planctomycetaceae bacterium]|jgi:hypothetical protein